MRWEWSKCQGFCLGIQGPHALKFELPDHLKRTVYIELGLLFQIILHQR